MNNNDILFTIFTYLPIYSVYSTCNRVCHQWNDVIQERRFKLFAIFQNTENEIKNNSNSNNNNNKRRIRKIKERAKAPIHESFVSEFDIEEEIEFLYQCSEIVGWDVQEPSHRFVPIDYKVPPLGFAVRLNESEIKSRYWRCAAVKVTELFPECDWNTDSRYGHCLQFFLQPPDHVLKLSPVQLPQKLIDMFDGDAEAAHLARRVFFERRGRRSCLHFQGSLESPDGKYHDEEYNIDYKNRINDIYQLRMCDFEFLVKHHWNDNDVDTLFHNMVTNRSFSKVAKEASSESFGGCNPADNVRVPLLIHILPSLPHRGNDPPLSEADQEHRRKTYSDFGGVLAQRILEDLGHIDAVKLLIAEAIDAPLFRTCLNTVKPWHEILELEWTDRHRDRIATRFRNIINDGDVEQVFSLDTDYHFGSEAHCEAFVVGRHGSSGRVMGFACIVTNGA